MKRLLAVTYLLLATCGGHGAPAHPQPTPPHPGSAAEVGLTEAECAQLFEHAVALGMIEQRARPPASVPTEDQQATVRAELGAKYDASCRAMSRRSYQCAVAASTITALATCDQASLSSSTSNSNVAPGGITPPAPREP